MKGLKNDPWSSNVADIPEDRRYKAEATMQCCMFPLLNKKYDIEIDIDIDNMWIDMINWPVALRNCYLQNAFRGI